MKIRRRKTVILVASVCLLLGLLQLDKRITRARNAADEARLRHVLVGMTEGDLVAVMGRQPTTMPGDAHRKYMFVGKRTPLYAVISAWNQPALVKTITIDDGRVTSVQDNLIVR